MRKLLKTTIGAVLFSILGVGCSQMPSQVDIVKTSIKEKVINLAGLMSLYSASAVKSTTTITQKSLTAYIDRAILFFGNGISPTTRSKDITLRDIGCRLVEQNGTDNDRDSIPSVYIYQYVNCVYHVPEGTVTSNGRIIIRDSDDNSSTSGFSYEAQNMQRILQRTNGSTNNYVFNQQYSAQQNTYTAAVPLINEPSYGFSYSDSSNNGQGTEIIATSKVSGLLTPNELDKPFANFKVQGSGVANLPSGKIEIATTELKVNQNCANLVEMGAVNIRINDDISTSLEFNSCGIR